MNDATAPGDSSALESAAPEHAALDAWRAVLAALPDAAWVFALATRRIVLANEAAGTLLGVPAQTLHGAAVDGVIGAPEDIVYWSAFDPASAEPLSSEVVLHTADGRSVPVLRSVRFMRGAEHGLVCLRDRSGRRRGEAERENLLAELQATLEATADGILVVDLDGKVRACNRRLAEVWGMPEAVVDGRDEHAINEWMRRSVSDASAHELRLSALRESPLLSSVERLELHSGQVLERVTRPLWRGGRTQGRVFSFRDLSDSMAADKRLAELSSTDPLTGLPNRSMMTQQVTAAVGAARRSGRGFALLVIDLDHFRLINDTLGHETGDRVLVDVARRIQGCLRSDDWLGRVGGDQFALLVDGAEGAAAEAAARRVLSLVGQPCEIEGVHFTLTCSIGVALCTGSGAVANQLVSNAESAMRQAKEGGRATWRVHQSRVGVDLRRQMTLDHAMRKALVSGRFRLHYQPQIDMASGQLCGAEALIRWHDPELGDIAPGQFIPVAEDTGFIVAIGDWVLSQAVRQATLWHERGCAVRVAVNVSALQFQQAQFVDRVASELAVRGLPPQLLELELTESILVRDAEEALHRLQALSRLGVRLSIDDFGTGYSSLAYLKRFPIDKLKIDRSFVMGLPTDECDAGIVRAILQVARAMNLKVIAEGVETESQRQFLLDAGCDAFQGYLFAPALDSLSFESRLLNASETANAPPRVRLVHG